MTDITLFHCPGACSRVTLLALVHIGLHHDLVLIDLMKGQHRQAAFLAVNPGGRVPALRMGGRVFTENAAILYHLHRHHPAAGLFPAEMDRADNNAALEDLAWCSSVLHPMTRQIRMPQRFTTATTEGVRAHGIQSYQEVLRSLEARLEDSTWWYGPYWSIIDAYIHWNYATAECAGLDLSAYPRVRRHASACLETSAYQQVLQREQRLQGDLPASG